MTDQVCIDCGGDVETCRQARREYEQSRGLAPKSLSGGLRLGKEKELFMCDVCVLRAGRMVQAMADERTARVESPNG